MAGKWLGVHLWSSTLCDRASSCNRFSHFPGERHHLRLRRVTRFVGGVCLVGNSLWSLEMEGQPTSTRLKAHFLNDTENNSKQGALQKD